jgi:hypothetical protein
MATVVRENLVNFSADRSGRHIRRSLPEKKLRLVSSPGFRARCMP